MYVTTFIKEMPNITLVVLWGKNKMRGIHTKFITLTYQINTILKLPLRFNNVLWKKKVYGSYICFMSEKTIDDKKKESQICVSM